MKKLLLSFFALIVSVLSLNAAGKYVEHAWDGEAQEAICGAYINETLGTYVNVTTEKLYYWNAAEAFDMAAAQISEDNGIYTVTFGELDFVFRPGSFAPGSVSFGEETFYFTYYSLYNVYDFPELDGVTFANGDDVFTTYFTDDEEEPRLVITHTVGGETKTVAYDFLIENEDGDEYYANFDGQRLAFVYEGWDCTRIEWNGVAYASDDTPVDDATKFAEYKAGILDELDSLAETASEEQVRLIQEAKSEIEACQYNEYAGLQASEMAVYEIYSALLEALNIPEGITNLAVNGAVKAYDLQGRRTNANRGIYVIGGKKVLK